MVLISPLEGLEAYLDCELTWRQSYGMVDHGDTTPGHEARAVAARAVLAPAAADGCAARASFLQGIINSRTYRAVATSRRLCPRSRPRTRAPCSASSPCWLARRTSRRG